MNVTYYAKAIGNVEVFYRESGSTNAPVILLMAKTHVLCSTSLAHKNIQHTVRYTELSPIGEVLIVLTNDTQTKREKAERPSCTCGLGLSTLRLWTTCESSRMICRPAVRW